jgi:hypothetical protein
MDRTTRTDLMLALLAMALLVVYSLPALAS